ENLPNNANDFSEMEYGANISSSQLQNNIFLYNLEQIPPMRTKIESYLKNALKKSREDFKEVIILKIDGDNENKLCLYCEKILMDS
ncbi:7681_t:CDS:2, partial [Funneliformis geosporum]